MATEIHTTAIVDRTALIDEDFSIGPFTIIGSGVKIKRGTRIMSHALIEGRTEIGEDCTIYPYASIGLPPQDLKYKAEPTGATIGSRNTIREYTTIHGASVGGDGITILGDGNFIMTYAHIAHDCKIGSRVIMANAATLAGHVAVEADALAPVKSTEQYGTGQLFFRRWRGRITFSNIFEYFFLILPATIRHFRSALFRSVK